MGNIILSLLITLIFVFLICFILIKTQQAKIKEKNDVLYSDNHIMDFEKYCNRYSVCVSIGEVELRFEQEVKE